MTFLNMCTLPKQNLPLRILKCKSFLIMYIKPSEMLQAMIRDESHQLPL